MAETSEHPAVFDQFTRAGYACQTRRYKNITEVSKTLFEGFFSVDSTKARLDREYEKFTKAIVSIHSDTAEYSYIKSRYFVDEQLGQNGVVEDIMQQINDSQPILFLIEAAAGFGKTCTAFELVKGIITKGKGQVPLFQNCPEIDKLRFFTMFYLMKLIEAFLTSILIW